MPKQTFINLSDEKREKIIDAGLKEFSNKGFREASTNMIVEYAGIPKGSFYQYFNDKKDLFLYICGIAAEKKLMFIGEILKKADQMDFFMLFKEMYAAGIKFARTNTKYFAISNELLKDNNLRKEMLGDQYERSNDFFVDFLQLGIKKGQVRKNIDLQFVSRFLTESSVMLAEYFLEKYTFDEIDHLEEFVDEYLSIIKNGIGTEA